MPFSRPLPSPPRAIRPPILRRAAFAALGFVATVLRIASRARHKGETVAPDAPIVLYEPFGMGDALLLQPLVRAWLNAGRRVTLAVRPAWMPLFPTHPALRIIPVAPAYAGATGRKSAFRLPRDLRSVAATLRPFARGAIGLDPRGDVRSLMIFQLAGCAQTQTLRRYYSASDCRVPAGAADIRFPCNPSVSRRRLSAVFAPPGADLPAIDLAHLLHPAPPPVGDLCAIPLTTWAGKMWPRERWAALFHAFRAEGLPFRILCGPGETAAARDAVGLAEGPVEEATDVGAWVRALSSAGLVLTVNTGPMHLADALRKPLIVLDGPSRLPLWAPEGPEARVLHHQDETPKAPYPVIGDGRREQRECMAKITVEEVLREVRRWRGGSV